MVRGSQLPVVARCNDGAYDFVGGFFFFNDTATTEIYTLSLHDALPILEELEMIDGECLKLDVLDGTSIRRQSLDFRFDQIEVTWPPPGKLVDLVQPYKEPTEFANVAGAVFT